MHIILLLFQLLTGNVKNIYDLNIELIVFCFYSCEGSVAAFPAVSHVQQKDKMNIMWNLKPVKFDFSNKSYALEKFPLWSSLLQKTTDENILCPENKKPFDAKATLKELKKEVSNCWNIYFLVTENLDPKICLKN